jgi:hypothetical protein
MVPLTIPAEQLLKELEERHLTSQSPSGKLNVSGTAAKPVIMTSGLCTSRR